MARRTKAEALATRDQILDAAEHVFERRGVSRTSLNDIAQAAGLTRGAIYWHFENKADLFHAMMRRVTLPLEEAAQRAAVADAVDTMQHLRASLIDTLVRTSSDPQVRRVFGIATHKVEFVDELLVLRERKLATRNGWIANVESGMARAARRGEFHCQLPPRVAAVGLHALIDGLIRNWTLDPSTFDLVHVGTQVLDAYLAGLAAAPGSPAAAARVMSPARTPTTARRPRQRTTP